MNVTHDPFLWCDMCHDWISRDRPAAILDIESNADRLPRICIDCLRLAVEACEREAKEPVVRGQRE